MDCDPRAIILQGLVLLGETTCCRESGLHGYMRGWCLAASGQCMRVMTWVPEKDSEHKAIEGMDGFGWRLLI